MGRVLKRKLPSQKQSTIRRTQNVTKLKLTNQVAKLKENRSLLTRLLTIAKSRPDVGSQQLGAHEISCHPRSLFASGGSLLVSMDNHKLMEILESLTQE